MKDIRLILTDKEYDWLDEICARVDEDPSSTKEDVNMAASIFKKLHKRDVAKEVIQTLDRLEAQSQVENKGVL